MPNLQELVPFFQQLFQEWTRFTLDNAAYAITLAISVWLLTAIGYSFSIAWLKRKIRQEQQAHFDTRTTLEFTQQQMQALQDQFNATNEQLTQSHQQLEAESGRANTEHQRGNDLEQKLVASNKRLAQGYALLVEKFELIENLPSQIGSDADALWQRCDAITARIVERFQNEQQAKARLQLDVQAEKTKLVDKDVLINSLQGRLDEQTKQLAKLETAVADQDILRNELDSVKRQLTAAIEKSRVEASRVVDQQRPTPASRPAMAERVVVPEPTISVTVEAPKPAEAVVAPVVQTEAREAAAVVEPAFEVSASEAAESKSMWKGLFGKSKKTDSIAAEIPSESVPKAVKPAPVTEAPTKPVVNESVPVAAKPAESKPVARKSKWGGLMEQFSKLDEKLGSPTSSKVQAEVEADDEASRFDRHVESADVARPVAERADSAEKTSSGAAGKVGGLFGGFKKSTPKAEEGVEIEPVPEVVADEVLAKNATGKLGGLLGKFKKN